MRRYRRVRQPSRVVSISSSTRTSARQYLAACHREIAVKRRPIDPNIVKNETVSASPVCLPSQIINVLNAENVIPIAGITRAKNQIDPLSARRTNVGS